jgi:hypothetical protein
MNRLALFPAVSLAIAACSGGPASSPSGSTQERDVVHPMGNVTTITITGPHADTVESDVTFDGGPVHFDTALEVAPGHHCVGLQGATDCFDIAANETKTYTFAAYTVADTKPVSLGLDISFPYGGFGYAFAFSDGRSTFRRGYTPGETRWMFPDAAAKAVFGASDAIAAKLEAGKITTLDFTRTVGRRTVVLLPPTRQFPNASCHGGTFQEPGDTLVLRGYAGNGSSAGAAYFTLDAPLLVGDAGGYSFTLAFDGGDHAPSIDVPVDLTPGTTIQLGRIDVDDVTLHEPGGATRVVPGSFILDSVDANGALTPILACPVPTRHGFDVPPGKYRVLTTYKVGSSTGTDDSMVTIH